MVRLFGPPGPRTYALQLLPVHFLVPADRPDRLFRAGPAQSPGSGDMAGAGLAGVLLGEQLAVRAAARGLGRVQLCHRSAADLETAAPCVARYALPHYALFVTYFPHLIAGPILHHKDMIPQFERAAAKRPDPHLILCGLIIFGVGLFKKTCLADGIQPLVSLAFGPNAPTFDQAWIGALAYTFQLYFDFSGYSDMAIGISLMFGIFLPLNFNSPYKAASIIDFWRRWHMTLSQFLRDYLYIPLGGNRHGRTLRYVNLMITMLLGGLWHGAAWTFVVWGALHGVYLCINHAWNNYGPAVAPRFARLANLAAFLLTFLSVVVAWVFFRADSLPSALSVLSKMADPTQIAFGRAEMAYALFIMVYAGIAWFAPNTQTMMGYDHKNRIVEGLSAWQKRPVFLYATAAVLAFGILGIQQHSEFIYFRF